MPLHSMGGCSLALKALGKPVLLLHSRPYLHSERWIALFHSWNGHPPHRRSLLTPGQWINVSAWSSKKVKPLNELAMTTSATNIDQGIFYAETCIKRAAERRADSTWLSNVFLSPEALVVPVLGGKSLVKVGQPALVSSKEFKTHDITGEIPFCNPIFLGLTNSANVPVFALDVSNFIRAVGDRPAWLDGCAWEDLRRYGPELQVPDAGLLAYACGMVEWHMRNKHCGRCGGHMEARDGGHILNCSTISCGNVAYPRLDPAVITLVTYGNYVLLGRQSRWDPGRYSLLAGFVEVGETFEMAVAREVEEETGIKVDGSRIRYAASQPWPFPSSLMVGFTAEAEQNQMFSSRDPVSFDQIVPVENEWLCEVAENSLLPNPNVSANELEDARWIHKTFLRAVLVGEHLPHNAQFHVPGKHAIARLLMERWVLDKADAEWVGDQIPTAEIDKGIFKYVLICINDNIGNKKLIVRGDSNLAYHGDIFKQCQEHVKSFGLQAEVLGGGRIKHLLEQHIIHVYGFSQAYGQANHAVTATILRQWFPFHLVSFSWEGY